MRKSWLPSAAMGLLPALLVGMPLTVAFVDGPPPAHTGGFGEPTCAACHFDVTDPDPAGSLTVQGLPEAYSPGARYLLAIRLQRPGMEKSGFQLSARLAQGANAGKQAGSLRAADAGTSVAQDRGIDYAHQNQHGTAPDPGGEREWTLEWTAPARAIGPVVIHVVGNAADGDESQFGDHVYADSATVPASPDGTARGESWQLTRPGLRRE